MTTSTLSAAAAALDSLLNGSQLSSSSAKPRRKKTVKKQRAAPSTVEIDEADLDPTTKRQRELEQQRRVEEAVAALKRSAKVKEEEMEVRKRILAMREEELGKKGKKRKAVVQDFGEDSD